MRGSCVTAVRRLALLGSLVIAANPGAHAQDAAPGVAPGEHLVSFHSVATGALRHVLVYLPSSLPASERTLVIVLHGDGDPQPAGNLAEIRAVGWNDVAEREGAVVFYPLALQYDTGRGPRMTWNDGRLGTGIHVMPDEADVDDAGFLTELIDAARIYLGVGDRVYVTGISNGGLMAYRLATDDRSYGRIRAIAPVVALLPLDLAGAELPGPMPLWLTVGASDPIMPLAGGDIRIQLEWEDGTPLGAPVLESGVVSVAGTAEYFARANGCQWGAIETADVPDTRDDGTSVRTYALRYCTGAGQFGQRADIEIHVVSGGGHRWQGRGGNGADEVRDRRELAIGKSALAYYVRLGLSTQDGFDATESAWQFFQRH